MEELGFSIVEYFVFDYTVKTKVAVINTPKLTVAPNAYVILGAKSHNKNDESFSY